MGFPVDAAAQGTRFDLWCFSTTAATLQAPEGFIAPRTVWMSPKFRNRPTGSIDCCFYPISHWQTLHDRLGARPSVGAMTIDLVSHGNRGRSRSSASISTAARPSTRRARFRARTTLRRRALRDRPDRATILALRRYLSLPGAACGRASTPAGDLTLAKRGFRSARAGIAHSRAARDRIAFRNRSARRR